MKIESNIKDVMKGFTEFEKKQIPYIQMLTANNIAFDMLGTAKLRIRLGLNIKKSSVPNSFRVRKATKQKPYAEVFVDEHSWQYKVLKHHFHGGDRERKGLEKALIHFGYMYRWEILTPSPGVKINPSTYVQIMSQLKLDYKAGYNSNETTKSRLRKTASKKSRARYFVITGKAKSPLAPGIYARMPMHDSPICILRISEKPHYKKKFDLSKTLNEIYEKRGFNHFSKAYDIAMFTAKKG